MRVACKLGREVLDEAAKAIAPGVTTDEIDRFLIFIYKLQKRCKLTPGINLLGIQFCMFLLLFVMLLKLKY